MSENYIWQLQQQIARCFNLAEFRTLCFALRVQYDSLGGEGLPAKVRELILATGRNERLPDLIQMVESLRPKVNWPPVPANLTLSQAVEGEAAQSSVIHHHYGDVNTFNQQGQQVSGNEVNVGGNATIGQIGDNITLGSHSDYVAGNKESYTLSGNFEGAIVNLKSKLDQVTQRIEQTAAPKETPAASLALQVNHLLMLLAQMPADGQETAVSLTEDILLLLEEAASEQSNRRRLEMMAGSIGNTAVQLASFSPDIKNAVVQMLETLAL